MKEKQRKLKWLNWLILPSKIVLFFCLFLALSFWGFVGVFIGYHVLVDMEAVSLMPPTYSNSIEIVSGEYSGGGSCCISKVWTYCTDASIDELIAYFEPYVGEIQLLEFYATELDYYSSGWVYGSSPLVKTLSYLSGFGGYSPDFHMTLRQNNEACMSGISYSYWISYPAA